MVEGRRVLEKKPGRQFGEEMETDFFQTPLIFSEKKILCIVIPQ